VASYMEGYWGMGVTVSSHSTGKTLETGSPGGGGRRGGNAEADLRRGLADRIEDNLAKLLSRAEEVLRENQNHVLALAHALESHKTLSGEDVAAVFEHTVGPVVDGRPYADPEFLAELDAYHESAVAAHRDHGTPQLTLPGRGEESALWASLTDAED
jgi:cell division protease FtsH